MSGNSNLGNAQKAKNDEFYTQYADIQKEINAYLEYDPNVFKDKTILLPCDDPAMSNFTKFFAQNFEIFGLKKLISTSYAKESKIAKYGQMSFWADDDLLCSGSPDYDPAIENARGKIFTLTRRNKRVDINDLQWKYLEGNGDFRSDEVKKLRDEADFIITNPPFSLFREFVAWLMESNKRFLVIGNMNAITYKEVFPLIKENRLWYGVSITSGDRKFNVPDSYPLNASGCGIDDTGKKFINVKGVRWFTNLEHGRRHQRLQLMSRADNIRFNKKLKGQDYQKYDNYDAIEVPFTDAIPDDYDGVMGVPISFLDKYCPEQFEILGITDRQNSSNLRTKKYTIEDSKKYNDLNARSVLIVNGDYVQVYARILIRKKQ